MGANDATVVAGNKQCQKDRGDSAPFAHSVGIQKHSDSMTWTTQNKAFLLLVNLLDNVKILYLPVSQIPS